MMIIVTGAAGFIGSAFIAKLNAEGITDILAVDAADAPGRPHNLANKRIVDFEDKSEFIKQVATNNLPQGVRAIVHMGACSATTERNVEFLRQNNTEYTQTLARHCVANEIRFIYASSAATYGDGEHGYSDDEDTIDALKPLNPYGDSKQIFDRWARDTGLLRSIVGLKFFNVYGPNEYYKGDMASIAWKAFNTIKATGSFSLFKSYHPKYKDGEQMRDFVYVKDCCDVMWWLLCNPSVNGLYNVGSGRARSWNDLLSAVFQAMETPLNIRYIEMPDSLRNQYQYFTEAPMSKLHRAGYNRPMSSLEEGVTDYIRQHLLTPDKHW
jgi:ADP-L-glycero-D-manno-heptose 6-epimerase